MHPAPKEKLKQYLDSDKVSNMTTDEKIEFIKSYGYEVVRDEEGYQVFDPQDAEHGFYIAGNNEKTLDDAVKYICDAANIDYPL